MCRFWYYKYNACGHTFIMNQWCHKGMMDCPGWTPCQDIYDDDKCENCKEEEFQVWDREFESKLDMEIKREQHEEGGSEEERFREWDRRFESNLSGVVERENQEERERVQERQGLQESQEWQDEQEQEEKAETSRFKRFWRSLGCY